MKLGPELLLAGYSRGIFPMVHDDGEVHWHDPDPRAVIPLDANGANRRLMRYARANHFDHSHDRCFEQVMRACADRDETWIDEQMVQAYTALHRLGFAHSVECWQNGTLIGGIYGVSIGAVFFGESMFSRANNASTWAFHHLLRTLKERGYRLFDTQYINDHTRRLGAMEIPRALFRTLLEDALAVSDRWPANDAPGNGLSSIPERHRTTNSDRASRS